MVTALLDVGNSTTQVAVYDGHTLSAKHTWPTDTFSAQDPVFQSVERCVISSVVPTLDPLLNTVPNPFFVTHETIPTLTLNLDIPEQVGADRLVAALAAYTHYATPAIVIDSGTVITFCHIDEHATYQGGAFFPGMGIASKALHDYTAKIPLIHVAPQDKLIGKTTQEAVEIGLYEGYTQLISGMIRRYRDTMPGVTIIGTGTWVDILHERLDLDVFDPELVLKGLQVVAASL